MCEQEPQGLSLHMQPRCVSPAGSQGRGLQNSEETQGVPSPRVLPVTLGAHHRVREEERDLKVRTGPRKPPDPWHEAREGRAIHAATRADENDNPGRGHVQGLPGALWRPPPQRRGQN